MFCSLSLSLGEREGDMRHETGRAEREKDTRTSEGVGGKQKETEMRTICVAVCLCACERERERKREGERGGGERERDAARTERGRPAAFQVLPLLPRFLSIPPLPHTFPIVCPFLSYSSLRP